MKPSLSCNNEPKICLSLWLRRKQLYHWFLGTSPTFAVITISLDAPKVLPSESLRQRKFWPLRSAANILHTCKGGNNGDDIKLCHWFPKFPFYHSYQIWSKDCLKYENRMQLEGTPFVPPPPHHHHWHYFDITKLPYQKQYPRHLLKSLRKWKFHCWVDLWWSSTIFRMNMTESCLIVNWQRVYDECPSYDGFSHMMCVLPIKW